MDFVVPPPASPPANRPVAHAAAARVGIVVIGRNEGERLARCLSSVVGQARYVVYVDSRSTDGSVALARGLGVEVVELDAALPFTAARARNAGLERLLALDPQLEFVQFVDGDCELRPGWLAAGGQTLDARPEVAVVVGHLREKDPDFSVYNRLCDLEWTRPVGVIAACGGVALLRVAALRRAGLFDPRLVAGEEPELCWRLRRCGLQIVRIDAPMASHDAAMHSFGQWWRRAMRSGYGLADACWTQRDRVHLRRLGSLALWGLVLPAAALAAAVVRLPLVSAAVGLLYAVQFGRLYCRQVRAGQRPRGAAIYAFFTLLSKFGELTGAAKWLGCAARRRPAGIIEYKGASPALAPSAEPAPAELRSVASACLYLAPVVPALSETFVYNEIRRLRARGLKVHVASVRPPARDFAEPDLARLAAAVIPVYGSGPVRLVRDMLAECHAHPARALGTLAWGLAAALSARDLRLVDRPKLCWQSLAALALAHRIRPLGVRHIHAHFAHVPTTLALIAARQLRIGFSFTGHANDLFQRRALLGVKLRRARFVACISQWHRAFYRECAPELPDERLPLVRCGVAVPPEAVRPGTRPQLRILGVGRLVPKKGFDVLLRAVAQLVAAGCELSCRIIGGGPEEAALRRLAAELQIQAHVLFDGPQPHAAVQAAIRAADVFVLPCRVDDSGDRDSIPVVLMEALAAGIPVLTGDLPAIRELVRHDDTGLLTPPGDFAAVAAELRRLYDDRTLLQSLGTRGREWVRAEFEREVNITRLCDAFQRHSATSQPGTAPELSGWPGRAVAR